MHALMQRTEKIRSNIRIVLVEPTHMGNIGACARAMGVMGLDQLFLVRSSFLTDEAFQRSAGARYVLENAQYCETLQEALNSCQWIMATSARTRNIPWPEYSPQEAAKKLTKQAKQAPVACVFGTENSGLTSKDLMCANAQIIIPANPNYSSLNLSMAVQILTYEIFKSLREEFFLDNSECFSRNKVLARYESFDYMQHVLEKLAVKSNFLHPQDLSRVILQLKAMILRGIPTQREINIFIGLLKKIECELNRKV